MANDDQGRLRNAVLTNSITWPSALSLKAEQSPNQQHPELVPLRTEPKDLRAAACTATTDLWQSESARESVGKAAGPASLALTWRGRRVRGLGPGLTSDSADAVRVVLRNDLPAGPQVFWHPPALPV